MAKVVRTSRRASTVFCEWVQEWKKERMAKKYVCERVRNLFGKYTTMQGERAPPFLIFHYTKRDKIQAANYVQDPT